MTIPWKTEEWWVGSINYNEKALEGIEVAKSMCINETTLRDGIGQVGVSITEEEAKKIAIDLDQLGVQQIEACYLPRLETYFPNYKRHPLREIVKLGLKAPIWTLCNLERKTVDTAAECGAKGAYIEVYGMKYKIEAIYGLAEEKLIEATIKNIEYAKRQGLMTSLFLAEATRSELEFLEKFVKMVSSTGYADRITVCDTMGCGTPHSISYLVRKVKAWSGLPIEVHCHNDLGLATANSVIAALSGAEIIHVTLLGVGERAGNAALEEVSISLLVGYGIDIGIHFEKLLETSNRFQEITGFQAFPFKPVVGGKVFLRESVLGAESLAKFPRPTVYEPNIVGQRHRIAMSAKSSEFSVEYKLKEIGQTATKSEIKEILARVIECGKKKGSILTEGEFEGIVKEVKKR